MTTRRKALLLTSIFLAGLLASPFAFHAIAVPQSIPARPATIAPGGLITAVVNETASSGWPHAVTQAEIIAVTDLAFWRAVKGGRKGETVSVRCQSGVTIATSRCGFVYRTKTTRRAYGVNVKVWEDGAYRITRAIKGGG